MSDLETRIAALPDKSLLLLDDDQALRTRMGRALEARGFQVTTAESVAEATQVLRDKAPAFAVLDMRLEDGNGLKIVEAVRDRVVVIGLLETLEYLVRGGRLSAAAGAVGTLLNVKPVVAVEDGLIVQLGKARGSKNGRNLLNQKVEKAGGIDFSMPLALGYTGLSDAVLKKYVEDSAALWAGHTEGELPVHTIGATIGTHVGPGAVAVAFFQPAN